MSGGEQGSELVDRSVCLRVFFATLYEKAHLLPKHSLCWISLNVISFAKRIGNMFLGWFCLAARKEEREGLLLLSSITQRNIVVLFIKESLVTNASCHKSSAFCHFDMGVVDTATIITLLY